MKEVHEAEGHDEALEHLMVESADWSAAFAESELAQCEVCQAVCAEQLRQERDLQALGVMEREGVEAALAAREPEPGPAEQLAREVLMERSELSLGTLRAWLRWLVPLAAAGLVLLFWPTSEGPGFDPNTPLGGAETEMQPRGQVQDFARFAWQAELPVDGWFEVQVYAEDSGGALQRLDASGRLVEKQWEPAEALRATWPREIIWKLEIHRGTSESDLAGAYWQRAERSSSP